jgi:hypothetical protein
VLEVEVGNLRVRDQLESIPTNGVNTEMDFQKELIDIGCLIWFKLGMKSWQM